MPITSHPGAEHTGTEIQIAFELDKAMRALGANRDQVVVGSEKSDRLYAVFERLGADPQLLGLLGSWGDGFDDEQFLKELRDYLRRGSIFDDIDIRAD
jgi:hypothetical protein